VRFVLLWLVASLFSAGIASARVPAPEAVLPLEQYRKGVAARVTVAGKPRLFTFDTGGGITIVSPALAREMGCTPFGRLAGHRMTGEKLEMPRCDAARIDWAGTSLIAPVAGVFDVTPLAAADAAPVDGLLALDIFAGKTVTLDMAGLTLTVETAESAAERIRGAAELPAKLAREIGGRALAVYVGVPSAQGPLAFELDSANGGTILVSKPYAALMGLDPEGGPQQGRFALAPGIEASGLMFAPDLLIDGNLGVPFMKHWVITMDLAHGRVWLKPSRQPPPPGMGVPPPLPPKQ